MTTGPSLVSAAFAVIRSYPVGRGATVPVRTPRRSRRSAAASRTTGDHGAVARVCGVHGEAIATDRHNGVCIVGSHSSVVPFYFSTGARRPSMASWVIVSSAFTAGRLQTTGREPRWL